MTVTAETSKETFGFQAEVKQILHLMIHSLYSNKEIFLRELISNASDAADKLRFESLNDDTLMEGDSDLKITVIPNKEEGTLTIRDNGIGMSRDEVISHLGTIAKSGTKEFLSSLTGDKAKDAQLIGQFGVGFYSSFIVADKVTVITRRAGSDEAVCWVGSADGEYTLEPAQKDIRGTDVILHLKSDENEYLEDFRLRSIITKYSDHISFPVMMPKLAAEEDTDGEANAKTSEEFEAINQATALWTRSKSEISDEEYHAFYKHVSHDFDEPLSWIHNRVEGKLDYTSLLFIPKNAPFDMWQRDQKHGLKLYVQRVFIMDEVSQFLPMYLRFVKGVIDTNDLPLNVSREILQQSKAVETIKSTVTKRVLGALEHMANNDAEKYQSFWEEFGLVLKEGPAEDFANKDQVARLLRFSSTFDDNSEQKVSLSDYVSRMKPDQKKIYYVCADSFAAAKNSPHLEFFRKQNIEVILLNERIDEWLMSSLMEFDGKPIVSVAKGALDLDELTDEKTKDEQKQVEEAHKDLIERVKTALGDKVKDVRVSHRLTESPVCIVADESDMTAQMERVLRSVGQDLPSAKPIFEINPSHALVKRLDAESDEARFKNWSEILLDQALLAEGGQLDDPASFVKALNEMMLELLK